MKLNTVV